MATIPEMKTTDYRNFLARKTQLAPGEGFEPVWLPDTLFGFQKYLVDWELRTGRVGTFADCGLGKTLMQLVCAENVTRKTGKKVIIVTPLAVAPQTVREGQKFGIDVTHSRTGEASRITVTNYERLHYFDPNDFICAIADESGAIKAFDGKRRKQVVRFFSKLPYRFLFTATPSPNDFIELGTQSECLGVMTQSDMLGFFFRETQNMRHTLFREGDFWNHTKWTFKPHSEQPFWRWVCSWARAVRYPSDIGFSDEGFRLPELIYKKHVLDIPFVPPGELYHRPAVSLHEQAAERKRTVDERCAKVADLLNNNQPAIAWCHYNEEGIALAKMIDGAVEVAGRHDDDYKEAALNDFALGNIRVLVSKPKIACWGMNYQHCGQMSFFPTFSFEQFYQGVRRCWRFGRKKPVTVHIVSAGGESRVMDGLSTKQEQAERMFASLVQHMNAATAMLGKDHHHANLELPSWLNTHEEQSCLS
jgi:hypothetical protein